MEKRIKVIIYATPICPYCTMAKNFLKENNIEFEEKNVADDEQAKDEMVKKSGQLALPVIDVNGKIILGYNRSELKKALGMDN